MYYAKPAHFIVITLFLVLLTSCSNLDIQTLNLKAKQLMDNGDIDGAISRLISINDLNPNYPQTHYNLGIAYYKKGEFDKAIDSLNKALELDKTLVDAHYSLGVIYEDIALSQIEANTKSKPKDELAALNEIIECFENSKKSYTSYLTLSKNSSEEENVKTKIQEIDTEINKYNTLVIEKYDSSMNNTR